MSQNDMSLANASGAAFRLDANNALQALVTNNSGATAPATTFAYMWWADTTAGILKQRNAANSAWINVLTLSNGRPIGVAEAGANSDITSLVALAAGGLPDNSVTTPDIANQAVTPAKLSQPFVSGTAVATTSGTAIDFTGIPSWAKRITVPLLGVSTNGASFKQLQAGVLGAAVTSGYLGNANQNATGVLITTGIGLASNSAADICHGAFVLTNAGGNTWVGTYVGGKSDAVTGHFSAGSITLAGVLNMVRLTTVNGTDTFDLGSANILIE
jgi:hypothetical protein